MNGCKAFESFLELVLPMAGMINAEKAGHRPNLKQSLDFIGRDSQGFSSGSSFKLGFVLFYQF